jgi:hypothetical protein
MKNQKPYACFFLLAALVFSGAQTLAQSRTAASGAKAAEAAKAANSATPSKSAYVGGRIFDKEFKLSKASYNSNSLMLRGPGTATNNPITPEAYQGIKIIFANNEQFEGKAFQVSIDQEKMVDGTERKSIPSLQLYATVGQRLDHYLDVVKNKARYNMTLNFYKRQKGLLPGFIDLEIVDSHTKIKGYFWAAPQ